VLIDGRSDSLVRNRCLGDISATYGPSSCSMACWRSDRGPRVGLHLARDTVGFSLGPLSPLPILVVFWYIGLCVCARVIMIHSH